MTQPYLSGKHSSISSILQGATFRKWVHPIMTLNKCNAALFVHCKRLKGGLCGQGGTER